MNERDVGKRGAKKVSKIINENSIEWVDIKCAMFAASIKQEKKQFQTKCLIARKKLFSLFFRETFSAFVETTIKIFGENVPFQFNFNNIRALTKRINMQKCHVIFPCLQF